MYKNLKNANDKIKKCIKDKIRLLYEMEMI